MKKLLIIVLTLAAFNMQAQEKKENRMAMKKERLSKMSPEEMAELQTKKMVLALDLTDTQQKQVQKLNLENAKLRLEKMKKRMALKDKNEKPSDKDRLKMQNERLDHMIANKREMKKILDDTQYEKWNEMTAKKHKMGKRKKRARKKEKS